MAKCDVCGKGVTFGHNVSHNCSRLHTLPSFRQGRACVINYRRHKLPLLAGVFVFLGFFHLSVTKLFRC